MVQCLHDCIMAGQAGQCSVHTSETRVLTSPQSRALTALWPQTHVLSQHRPHWPLTRCWPGPGWTRWLTCAWTTASLRGWTQWRRLSLWCWWWSAVLSLGPAARGPHHYLRHCQWTRNNSERLLSQSRPRPYQPSFLAYTYNQWGVMLTN